MLCRDSKDETARLGMAISKKHCRKATQRNRIKRVVRESFRKNQQQLAGLDIVVINQPAAAMADNGSMNDSLEQHWQRCTKAKQKLTERDS